MCVKNRHGEIKNLPGIFDKQYQRFRADPNPQRFLGKKTKERDPSNPAYRGLDGSAEYIKSAIEASLRRLALDHVDLLYLHRVDPKIPFEESVKTLADLVREGKARAIGFSEITPEQIKTANVMQTFAYSDDTRL